MKCLFANPPGWDRLQGSVWSAWVRAGSRWPFTSAVQSRPDGFRWGGYLPFPHFLAYAASYAAKATGAVVSIRDSIASRESYGTFYKSLEGQRYDYIFIETGTPSWVHDAGVIAEIHRRFPETKIVVCGPITATRGDELLECHLVHACIKGEYERGAVRVINGESGLIEHDLLTVSEMNAAPPPMMPAGVASHYFDANPRGQIPPQMQVWSSRGCWAKCCFCSWPATMTGNDPDGTKVRSVRHYTPDYMAAFLMEWKGRYGFRCVYFDDDLFNTSDKHVLAMCEVMRTVNLPWSSMCRADTINRETWQAMKDSGCTGVKIGMESGSQRVLDDIVNKRLDLAEAVQTLHWLKKIGINAHTTWTVGLPGETKEEQQITLDMIQDLYAKGLHVTHQLSGTANIDGTPLHAIGLGKLLKKYPGAVADDNYLDEADGNKKIGTMKVGTK